jgi:hypothetical protein
MTPPSSPTPPENPFEIGLPARDRRSANREHEVERIAHTLQSAGDRLVVYGDRRLGKSSALDRSAEIVRKVQNRGAGEAAYCLPGKWHT